MADSSSSGSTRLLTSLAPQDAVLSPDGETLYVGDASGRVTVVTVDSGATVATWNVGESLGGLSISPDGRYLSATAQEPVGQAENEFGETVSVVAAYRIDTQTGAIETYELTTGFYDYTFADSAFLSDGSIVLTQNFQGSGWTDLRILDPEAGTFENVGRQVRHGSILTVSDDYSALLIGETDISNAPLLLYDVAPDGSITLTAESNVYDFNASGFNSGVQALSSDGSLAVQWIYYSGLYVLDESLQLEVNIFDREPSLFEDTLSGVAFDHDGDYLYVLDETQLAVIQLSTQTWKEVTRFELDRYEGSFETGGEGGYGNNLLVTDDDDWLIVTLSDQVLRIDAHRLDGTDGIDLLLAGPDGMKLYGFAGSDILFGDVGADTLVGGSGTDRIDGGTGIDTACFSGNRSDYIVTLAATGVIVSDTRGSAGDGRDFVVEVENFQFADATLTFAQLTEGLAPLAAHWRFVTTNGFEGGIGGTGEVFGTTGFDHITVLEQGGDMTFDPSFARGGDVIELPGDADEWTVSLSGSNAVFVNSSLDVTVPIGSVGTFIAFDDGVQILALDVAAGVARIGGMAITATAAPVSGTATDEPLPDEAVDDAVANLYLASGAEVTLEGTVNIFGTFAIETVVLQEGDFTFDPSFNQGGDTVFLPGMASDYVVSQLGSSFVLEGAGVRAILPAGQAPTTLSFETQDAYAYFDSDVGSLFIGNQEIGADPVSLTMIG